MPSPAKEFIDDCPTRISFPSHKPARRILEFPPVCFVVVFIDHGFKHTADDGFIFGTNQPVHNEMPLTLFWLNSCPLGHQQLFGIEPVHLYFCTCLKGLINKKTVIHAGGFSRPLEKTILNTGPRSYTARSSHSRQRTWAERLLSCQFTA